MKKYRSIIVLAVILLISVIGCAAVLVSFNRADVGTTEYSTRLFAKKTKTLFLPGCDTNSINREFYSKEIVGKEFSVVGGRSVSPNGSKLKYVNTVRYYGKHRYDIYTDMNPDENTDGRFNEYYYDMSGNLVSFKIYALTKDVNIQNASDLFSEEQAIELARKYICLMYGGDVDDYEHERTVFTPEMHTYGLSFAKKYGFAVGERFFVDICTNGVLFSTQLSGYEDYKDFDMNLLSGTTEKDFSEAVGEFAKAIYPLSLVSYEIDSVNLKKINNKYYLKAVINIDYRYNNDILHDRQDYYYELD